MSPKSPKPRPPAPDRGATPRGAAARRAAAAQERLRAAERRRRLLVVGGPSLAVVLVIAVLVVVRVAAGSPTPRSGERAGTAATAAITALTSVPAAVLDAVGSGSVTRLPSRISGAPLTQSGKPRLLYIGAEYCPFCAAQRWAVVVALSRFGRFSGLGETTSSPSDVYPSTRTVTFHGAAYSSTTLAFAGVETESNQVQGAGYAKLDTLTAADAAIMQKYDGDGSIPFFDIGNRYLVIGGTYDPGVLQGKSFAQIAAALSDPSSPIAQGVDGTANIITAAICESTGDTPAAVCRSAGVRAAAQRLAHA